METIMNQGSFVLYEDVTGSETAVTDYIEQAQRDREMGKELTEKLRDVMVNNKETIIKHMDHYNYRKDTKFTFDNMVNIAVEWDIEDMQSLLSLCEKKNFKEFVNVLANY